MPGSLQSTSCMKHQVILTTALRGWSYYHCQFIDEGTGAQSLNNLHNVIQKLAQGHTVTSPRSYIWIRTQAVWLHAVL